MKLKGNQSPYPEGLGLGITKKETKSTLFESRVLRSLQSFFQLSLSIKAKGEDIYPQEVSKYGGKQLDNVPYPRIKRLLV